MKYKYSKKIVILLMISIIIAVSIYVFTTISEIVRNGYDKQNKVVLFIKSIVSPHYIKKIKNNLFIIPNLKSRNEFLELQIEKYEQGNDGKKFDTKVLKLDNNENYEINFFFLPFKRLDTSLGWNAEENSLRAHYSEIYDGNFFSISGEGKTVFFNKNNFLSDRLKFKDLPNNINEIIKKNNLKLIGIRDLFIHNNQIFITMLVKNDQGTTINLYKANLNYEKINFNLFFESKEFWEGYNVFSGGRLENFKDEKILFSVGFAKNYEAPQNKKSLLGKIILIDLNTKKYELISYGHRNPQGLSYYEPKNIVINTEHGPKGGDEINLNFLNANGDKNFGWPKVSYGKAYPGEEKLFEPDTFKKTHNELGYNEPFKYYDPSIGISEILHFEKNSFCQFNCLIHTSLRANSIFILDVNNNFTKIISNKRIFLKGNRIRDIDFDKDLDLIILTSENVPALVTVKKLN